MTHTYYAHLSGDANYSKETIDKVVSKLYSKDFFKKFPKVIPQFKKAVESLHRGRDAAFPLSLKSLAALKNMNEKLVKKGVRPPVNIHNVRTEGYQTLSKPWIFKLFSDTDWDGDEVIYLHTLDHNKRRSGVSGRRLYSDSGRLSFEDLLSEVDFFWCVANYEAYVGLTKCLEGLALPEEFSYFITEDGLFEEDDYEFRNSQEEGAFTR